MKKFTPTQSVKPNRASSTENRKSEHKLSRLEASVGRRANQEVKKGSGGSTTGSFPYRSRWSQG